MPVTLVPQEAEIRKITVQILPLANSSHDHISKKPITKRTGGVAQSVSPEFKFQCHKKRVLTMREKIVAI
jgi:hypothetical protein